MYSKNEIEVIVIESSIETTGYPKGGAAPLTPSSYEDYGYSEGWNVSGDLSYKATSEEGPVEMPLEDEIEVIIVESSIESAGFTDCRQNYRWRTKLCVLNPGFVGNLSLSKLPPVISKSVRCRQIEEVVIVIDSSTEVPESEHAVGNEMCAGPSNPTNIPFGRTYGDKHFQKKSFPKDESCGHDETIGDNFGRFDMWL